MSVLIWEGCLKCGSEVLEDYNSNLGCKMKVMIDIDLCVTSAKQKGLFCPWQNLLLMLVALGVKNCCTDLVVGHTLTLVEIKDYVMCSRVDLLAFNQTANCFNFILFSLSP